MRDDCNKAMIRIKSNTIDTIITDPPYGLKFMNKKWDYEIPSIECFKRMLRIAKPGAFLLCFGGTRTYHRMACNIEDAGWQIRDCIMWLYGSGFPKSFNISKAIDKAKGKKRKRIADNPNARNTHGKNPISMQSSPNSKAEGITVPASKTAQLWDGWGTGLKPAFEPIIVAMKPLDGTFAHNAEEHGVSGFHIDGARIGTSSDTQGRWPANIILDKEAGLMLDKRSGYTKKGKYTPANFIHYSDTLNKSGAHYGDPGGASRFFYCAKASKKERNAGCEHLKKTHHTDRTKKHGPGGDNPSNSTNKPKKNFHPTVKPLDLMRYLCKLTQTPTGGLVLDPFMGSATTGLACKLEGRHFIGIEKDPEYYKIAKLRIRNPKRKAPKHGILAKEIFKIKK